MTGSALRLERMMPVPRTSPAGATAFSEINSNESPARALRDAFRAGRVPVGDLPEIIANVWTRNDSPTTDLGEADWIELFRAIGFFSWPPFLVRQPDGASTPFRPVSTLVLYRGSTADRLCRMSWASDRRVAEELGRRHARYGPAALYKAAVPADMILAYLERRDDWGWTIVVDPAGLTAIERIEDITPRNGPA